MSGLTREELLRILEPFVAPADAKIPEPLRKPKRRPQKLHIYTQDEGDIAREMGVQIRSWCGVWVWPRRERGPVAVPGDDEWRCQRCERILRSKVAKGQRFRDA